jgi:hypothetical protein
MDVSWALVVQGLSTWTGHLDVQVMDQNFVSDRAMFI